MCNSPTLVLYWSLSALGSLRVQHSSSFKYVNFLRLCSVFADYKKHNGLARCPLKSLSGEPNTPTTLRRRANCLFTASRKSLLQLVESRSGSGTPIKAAKIICRFYGIIYPLSSAFSTILTRRLHCAADGREFRLIYSAILPINATSPYGSIILF